MDCISLAQHRRAAVGINGASGIIDGRIINERLSGASQAANAMREA